MTTFDITPFRDLYPWQGSFFEVKPGVRMHYLDEGRVEGQPREVMVMLHGNPTWSLFFRHLVTAFSKDYRCIVPDHVGCGLSDKPDDGAYDYVLDKRVDDLEALLEKLGVKEKITLVVHDWGGMIGMAYATRHPERIARLVVFNTAGFGLPEGRRLPWQIALIRHLPFAVPVRGFNAFSVGATMTCSTVPGRLTSHVKQAYLAPYDNWANRIAVHRFVQDIPLQPGDRSWATVKNVSDKLGQFDAVPTLILWGERDFVFNDAFLAEWRRRLPHAEVHTFPDAGHYVLEDAHERIVPKVADFLARHPLAAAASVQA
jgi:haloalkane dehalogenase